jgi:hypothetical protein
VKTIDGIPRTVSRRCGRKPTFSRTRSDANILAMSECTQPRESDAAESGGHPRCGRFGREASSPRRLCEPKTKVGPSLISQDKKARITYELTSCPLEY